MLGKSKAKYIQSLGQKKQRDEDGLFIAEGPKIVAEMIQSVPQLIKEIYAVSEWIKDNSFINSIEIIEVTAEELEKISQLKTPNQVLAVVNKFKSIAGFDVRGKLSIALDTIQDPGNLGTIIRIADWFGIDQVICSKECADVFNPKVVQASMGSIARVKIFYTDLHDWLLQQKQVPVYLMMLEGKDVTSFTKLKEGVIVVGNESRGIGEATAGWAANKITIPKKGKAESLNAAVALGIVLSHVV